MIRHAFYAVVMMAFVLFLASCDHMGMQQPAPVEQTAKPQTTTVTIVHNNDFHSQFDPLHPAQEVAQGGAARLKTLVDGIRAEKGEENVLLLNAGDNFQGTMFYNTWRGSAEVMFLNHMRYDAVTFGNHEFDSGSPELARALTGGPVTIAGVAHQTEPAHFLVVNSNIDASTAPELAPLFVKRAVIHKGGNTYGIVGATTTITANTSSPGPNVHFLDYVPSVQQQVDALRAEGVDKIILLSHSGSDVDMANAAQLSGVDVIIAGHDHALFGDKAEIAAMGLPNQAARVVSSYPTIVKDKDGHNTVIVSAMEKGRWLGNIDVTFDAEGNIPDGGWSGHPIFVRGCTFGKDAEGKPLAPDCSQQAAIPDPELTQIIDSYRAPMDEASNQLLGSASVDFAGRHAAGAANVHSMGNLTADIILAFTKDSDHAQAAIVNRGGMRADLPKGEVRYKDINTVLPFDNTVTVLDLTGAELLEAMDVAISEAGGKSYGAYPHVSGMSIRYCSEPICDGALLEGGRITSLKVQGKDVQSKQTYRIATNDYLARGGDFYTMFKIACEREGNYCRDTGTLLRDVVADWFRSHSPVGPVSQDRVVMVK